ncbi:MAG: protein-disulfide reductase DsbD [Candidatus Eisenbacteria bacterium]|nr:protein-disulfide reductase DsbD [Candidatus Eisenbacteria bacterium]
MWRDTVRHAAAIVLGTAIALLIPASGVLAQESPFSTTAEAVRPAGDANRGEVIFRVAVPAGHYLYRDEVSVELEDGEPFLLGETAYPAGKVKYDAFLEEEVEIYNRSFSVRAPLSLREGEAFPESVSVVIGYRGCTSEACFFPERIPFTLAWREGAAASSGASATVAIGSPEKGAAEEAPRGAAGGLNLADRIASRGLFWAYLFVFVSGILLSFTPCVFPMIPITLSVIGARGEKNPAKGFLLSLIYVLGMALTYSVLGLLAASGGMMIGSFMQSPIFIGAIVAIFVALALGMFGLYELQVPSGFAARLNRVGGGGGWIGIFLMGIVAGLVASPCVGPVLVGLLVYIAQTGNAFLGFTLLFTLAMGIGVLFLVIGTFSGLLATLPGAGGWMDGVKRVFGFLLLGVALYFAAPLLPDRLVHLAMGALLTIAASFFGLFETMPEGAGARRRVVRAVVLLIGAAGVAFFLGAAVLPLLPIGTAAGPAGDGAEISWIRDHDAGLAAAREAGRPVMIDFTAQWCAACKELEHVTYRDPAVIAESRRFTMVLVDCTRKDAVIEALLDRYHVKGLPTIVWIDSSGERVDEWTVTGFVEPDDFAAIMRRVR